MTKIRSLNPLKFLFSMMEVPLLFLPFIAEKWLIKLSPNDVKVTYLILIFIVTMIETVYLVRVIKSKKGFIGLPIMLILIYRFNILEKHVSPHSGLSNTIIAFFVIIILLRIFETIYLYKNKNATHDLFSYKVILASVIVDSLSILQFTMYL